MADVRVADKLPLVVPDLRLGDGTRGVVFLPLGGRMVGRQDGGGGADDGTHFIVHLFGLGLVDQLRRDERTGRGVGRRAVCGDGHARMLVQVVMVVRLGSHHRARLARLGEVDIGVRRGECRVGGANDGAVLRGGRCHFAWIFPEFSSICRSSILLCFGSAAMTSVGDSGKHWREDVEGKLDKETS